MQLGRYRVVLLYVGALLAIAIGAAGCAVKKNLVQEEVKTAESKVTKIETVSAPVLNQALRIEEPCDSVEIVADDGKIYKAPPKYKEFNYQFQIDSLKGQISFKQNTFELYIGQVAKVLKQKDSIIAERDRQITKIQKEVVGRFSWRSFFWTFIAGFAAGALLIWLKPWKKLFV